MFLRESEGVYQFGQRRVYIKVEKGNNLLVRVGGGFMHIQDFIQQYTGEEVERLNRRDVFGRYQAKLKLQEITMNADAAVERTPVRSPQRSLSAKRASYHSPGDSPVFKKLGLQRRWSNQRITSSPKREPSPFANADEHCHHLTRRHRGMRRSVGGKKDPQPKQTAKGKKITLG